MTAGTTTLHTVRATIQAIRGATIIHPTDRHTAVRAGSIRAQDARQAASAQHLRAGTPIQQATRATRTAALSAGDAHRPPHRRAEVPTQLAIRAIRTVTAL